MKRIIGLLLCFILVLSMLPVFASDASNKGSLVIVGGALRSDNDAVFEAFIELAGGAEKAKIGVVPAASGSPSKYYKMFVNDMTSRGLSEAQVVLLPLLTKDDKKTEGIDESTWITNGNNPDVAALVSDLTGIWFIGGDQTNITKVLLNKDDSDTLVLKKMREIHTNGAVIGGTSAGAAIMSEVMIAGGDSLNALSIGYADDFDASSLDYQNEGGLIVTKGLGFFKEGIIDQHFDRKARLGRLAVVSYDNKEKSTLSFGVEENTALIYNQATKIASVAGTGGVVILDSTNVVKGDSYKNFLISYIEGNDKFNLAKKACVMDEDKYTTIGYEYLYTKETVVGGAVSPNQRLRDFIAFELIDNEAKSEIKTYLFGEGAQGFEFVFKKGAKTEGYWGQSGAADLYSFENVEMDINKVKINISTANTYKVKDGDMLWKIAKEHNADLSELIKVNSLKNPNKIISGQVLIIPFK